MSTAKSLVVCVSLTCCGLLDWFPRQYKAMNRLNKEVQIRIHRSISVFQRPLFQYLTFQEQYRAHYKRRLKRVDNFQLDVSLETD